mgnify:CR=1 FL=1
MVISLVPALTEGNSGFPVLAETGVPSCELLGRPVEILVCEF